MTIFTSLYSIPNHDRIESWRGAFRYLKQAEPLFQVRPKTRINLATKTRKCLTTHPQAGQPHQCAATGPESVGRAHQDRIKRTGTAASGMPSPSRTEAQRGKPHRRAETGPDFNEKPPGNIRFVCTCALDAIVFVVGVALAFGMLVVAGVVMNAI